MKMIEHANSRLSCCPNCFKNILPSACRIPLKIVYECKFNGWFVGDEPCSIGDWAKCPFVKGEVIEGEVINERD